ncbi:hypothetical protein SAY86_013844 [Trapa natans]|uniref:Uncharacterized protein n=1 Tax=Trapa natans TaxID=22666 RepID=A0AAN7QM74_TRANT|nr:hypothetical protein SAY86_013844 [Trapa natans]
MLLTFQKCGREHLKELKDREETPAAAGYMGRKTCTIQLHKGSFSFFLSIPNSHPISLISALKHPPHSHRTRKAESNILSLSFPAISSFFCLLSQFPFLL